MFVRLARTSVRGLATKTATKTATATTTEAAASAAGSASHVAPVDPLEVIPSQTYGQAPNRAEPWSASQRSRDELYKTDPRFVGKDLSQQPQPLSAMELISQQPVIKVNDRIAVCHGTDFVQGHPKIYINLEKGVSTCGYCGQRYEQDHAHGHGH